MLCTPPGFKAPPGAGKTTVVPLAMLLHAPEYLSAAAAGGKKIMVLEPRRVAAKAAARRMASMLGEAVGGTVGYRVKLDTRVGPKTRIEVRALGWFLGIPSYIEMLIFTATHSSSLHTCLCERFLAHAIPQPPFTAARTRPVTL